MIIIIAIITIIINNLVAIWRLGARDILIFHYWQPAPRWRLLWWLAKPDNPDMSQTKKQLNAPLIMLLLCATPINKHCGPKHVENSIHVQVYQNHQQRLAELLLVVFLVKLCWTSIMIVKMIIIIIITIIIIIIRLLCEYNWLAYWLTELVCIPCKLDHYHKLIKLLYRYGFSSTFVAFEPNYSFYCKCCGKKKL